MDRRKKLELFEIIRREFQQGGHSIRSIASKYQIHRRMVRQALASAIPPERKICIRPAHKLDAVKDFIDQILQSDTKSPRKQRHTAHLIWTRIHQEMPQHALSESSVRKYVREQKEKLGLAGREVFVPQSYMPGEEAQVDWYEALCDIGCNRLKLYFFCMRSMASGAAFHCAFSRANQQAFLEAHERAFHYFGGVFRVIRYDNLTSAVKKILRGYRREENSRFIEFRSHWGFAAEFCNPGKGHEKGGVEGEGGFFRRNHLVPIPAASDLTALNEMLFKACKDDEKRIIGERQQTAGALLANEQKFLQPLPPEGFDLSEDVFCRVNKQGCVVVRTNWYSVPARVGLEIHAKVYADRVVLLQKGQCVAEHERSYGRKQRILDLEHYLDILERKPGAFAGSTPLQQWREQGRWPADYDLVWQSLKGRNGKSNGTKEMIELLQLGKKYGYDRLSAAFRIALEKGCSDSAAIKHLLLNENTPAPKALPLNELGNLKQYEMSQPDVGGYDLLMEGIH